MPKTACQYVISVHQNDLMTGEKLTLVHNAIGLKAAAQCLGSSVFQMSRFLNGKCKYGSRTNGRFEYEFIKQPLAVPLEDAL
jgi:hypothetical protein